MEIQWNPISKVKLGIKSFLSAIIIIFLMFEDLKCWEGASEKPKIKYV